MLVPHFCRFSKVCKCIRHTIIIIIATYKFPGYMPSARSCFKALLKDSRNMQTFFDQLWQKICSFYYIALFQFRYKPLHGLLKPRRKLYMPRDYKWLVTVSQPANNFYYNFRSDNIRSSLHFSQTKLKHFWVKYYVDFKFLKVLCKSSAIK